MGPSLEYSRIVDFISRERALGNNPYEEHILNSHLFSRKWEGSALTLKELLDHAASECIDKRESYLVIFTVDVFGYVCRNESSTDESRAVFHGTYRECQIWIERRGIAAALVYVLAHIAEVPELSNGELSAYHLLEMIGRLSIE